MMQSLISAKPVSDLMDENSASTPNLDGRRNASTACWSSG